ncbi:hypothetical protein M6B38_337465 [Iris pallida]|uniref:Uncharacterized protein n=1 Tax=Iris pallida TaxID=29817 RepID=A0AAX6H0C2_IRIPA|nr:hypothetical protein M6B38_337465 [Iris pallida]
MKSGWLPRVLLRRPLGSTPCPCPVLCRDQRVFSAVDRDVWIKRSFV